MPGTLHRRDFLKTTAVTAATLTCGQTQLPANENNKPPLFKISLAQWSLNRRFFKREKPYLDNLDFAKTARSLGIEAVEYVNQFFKDKANDKKYLGEMKKRASGENVQSLLIMIDSEGNLGEPEAAKRHQAVENHHKWVHAAKFLGCHSIRVNARSDAELSFGEQMKLAADGLRKLTEFAAKHEMNVLVENHGGLSSNGQWLAGVMKRVDHPRLGTLPDFGNFAVDHKKNIWYDRYQGVKELMPYAKAVSAKAHAFDKQRPFVSIDERSGKETDFLKMMRIVLDAGYRGWVGIESEGSQGQIAGIKDTHQMLKRVREKLQREYNA